MLIRQNEERGSPGRGAHADTGVRERTVTAGKPGWLKHGF